MRRYLNQRKRLLEERIREHIPEVPFLRVLRHPTELVDLERLTEESTLFFSNETA